MEGPKIGFIGIGVMGEPMALNLLKAGTPLVVWNRSPQKCESLRLAGARVASSLAALFAETKTVILMLATEAAVDAVLDRGSPDFAARVGGHTIIHMGTVSAEFSRSFDADIRASGGRYVEAPVSGSRKPAELGQLVAMLAGDRAIVDEVSPLLAPMCHKTTYCGDVPKALLMKFATNAFLIPLIASLAEAFHLADQYGLDRQQFLAVINGGQMASAISRVKAEKLAVGDFDVQAAVSDVLKNNHLAAGTAHAHGVASPLLDLCAELFGEAEALGLGQQDAVAVVRALEARTQNRR